MKILYYSDTYTQNVMGTKRSIREEVERRGHQCVYHFREEVSDVLRTVQREKPDQVWLAHSALLMHHEDKAKLKIPVIGFGFSDPYYFSSQRFKSYDAYVTNHWNTLMKHRAEFPMHYNPTACDFNFHKDMGLKRENITLIGLAQHPRFGNANERIDVTKKLRTLGVPVLTYGAGWGKGAANHGPIAGEEFLTVINKSVVGLDIQDDFCPMAHRMFEYAACGTPVITRRRPEVFKFFKDKEEILTYDTHEELYEHLYNNSMDDFANIGAAARARCFKEHNITHRVDKLLAWAKKL